MRTNEERGTYSQPGIVHIYGSFQTNGSSAPTVIRDGNARLIYGSGSLGSVVRTSAGLYTITFDSGFPMPPIPIIFNVSNHCLANPTSLVTAYFVEGSYTKGGNGQWSFQIQVVSNGATPKITTGLVVSSNTATLPNPGVVTQVHATIGTSTGIKTIILTGAPAAGQVAVSYNAAGVPTLTFNAADAITAASYVQVQQGVVDADSTVRVDFEIVGALYSAGMAGTDPA